MMGTTLKSLCLAVSFLVLATGMVQAQLTREAGAGSIAGTLQKSIDDFDEFEFSSRGNQALFVDLDADIYITQDPHAEHDTGATVTAEAGEEGGCADGGNGRFMLEVLTLDLTQVCMAGKPSRPGWDTDPRLACFLPNPGDYLLRVTLVGAGGHEEPTSGGKKIHPYLLNVSLRDLASDFPGVRLDKAVKESVNILPYMK